MLVYLEDCGIDNMVRHVTILFCPVTAKLETEVTGSNKGIGLQIVKGLCQRFKGDVYLTARNEDLGHAAVHSLKAEGLNPKFHQLDITDIVSINSLRDHLQEQYGGLDVLVNNAGIAFKENTDTPFPEQARMTSGVNFFSQVDVCDALFPLLRPHARVVNMSSTVSQWSISKCNSDIQVRFTDAAITLPQLKALVQEFIDAAQTNEHVKQGWPDMAYGVSKIGMTVLTFIQHRELSQDRRSDIVINSCCPGYVQTDMTSNQGPKTPEQGADTPLFLALLPPTTTTPNGEFVSDRKIQKWG
ncbi:Carbonyl reductase [NADPH] 1 [Mizuhopecten yessoensis]|uniref:carbonyl reductase (NADPH) n=1 Tax=Mizuhopecten yessoensis TaxID=6573 RepID=A0A210QR25_MIZYE|nr:Carbonyl reductase [NADPH] 1 [Mizuhopecten yessoensis]